MDYGWRIENLEKKVEDVYNNVRKFDIDITKHQSQIEELVADIRALKRAIYSFSFSIVITSVILTVSISEIVSK